MIPVKIPCIIYFTHSLTSTKVVMGKCLIHYVPSAVLRRRADAHETRARKIVPRYAAVLRSTSKV